MKTGRIRIAILCVCLGWVAAVLASWGLAWRGIGSRTGVRLVGAEGGPRWFVQQDRTFGGRRVAALRVYADDHLQTFQNQSYILTMVRPSMLTILDARVADGREPPAWAELETRVEGEDAVVVSAFGWPLPCMSASVVGPQAAYPNLNPRPGSIPGLGIGGLAGATAGPPGPRAPTRGFGLQDVPLRPMWMGLVVNSVLYGVLFFALFQVVSGLRSRRERHRGHCPKCTYDLCGDLAGGCPECGWGRGEGQARPVV